VSDLTALLETAKADVDSGWLPACQLAVARDGEMLAFETYGDATNTTRFGVFSATKPIVASAMWLLIAQGKLDVARPVAEYIPEFATFGKELVTVEQVMVHTAGLPNAPMDLVKGSDPAHRVAQFAEWQLEWEPGTRFEYHATSAHWVLADLIERLSGLDFRDFVEQYVTAPHGLPRVLGIPIEAQDDIAPGVEIGEQESPMLNELSSPDRRVAGVPGGGGIMTAAVMATFYQALLHNPAGVWDPAILHDAKTNIRCVFPDPMMGVPANRTLGLVLAGDDGMHMLRYAIFGEDNSPGSFGHAGAHAQVAWADPASGVSFCYLSNALDADVMREALRSNRLSTLASQLEF